MKKAVLYYSPYAGASTVSFKNMNTYISEDIETVCIEYPGHGKRIEEQFADSVNVLANDVVKIIEQRNDDVPIYLSGHCLGALVAYEVYYLMKEKSIKGAARLIISGQGTPDNIISEHLQSMNEDELLEYLVKHGLVDSAMAEPRLRGFVSDLILKPIVSDSIIYDKYVNAHNESADVPIDILYGSDDDRYPPEKLEMWNDFTNKGINLYPFSGGHYFLRNYEKEYFEKINEIIEKDFR